jgi:chemotaxis-related protein WspB
MLILTLNIGKERYGIEANQIVEVTPLVEIQHVPVSDSRIKGIFNYRGTSTPVIDLCQIFGDRPCKNNMSTRIIIIEQKDRSDMPRPIGMIAEHVTAVLSCDIDKLTDNGIVDEENNYFDLVYRHNDELIQIINTRNILPKAIASLLMDEIDAHEQSNI